jgi:hypothetical protein
MQHSHNITNPFPHFTEAAHAARDYLMAQREHLLITAEIRARREGKRAAFATAAAVSALFALSLFFFWITFEIREAGVPSWGVALISLGFFATVGGVFFALAKRSIHAPSSSTASKPSLQEAPPWSEREGKRATQSTESERSAA